jgi:hypothetical protein
VNILYGFVVYSKRVTHSDALTLVHLIAARTIHGDKSYKLLYYSIFSILLLLVIRSKNSLDALFFKYTQLKNLFLVPEVVPYPFIDSSRKRQQIFKMAANILILITCDCKVPCADVAGLGHVTRHWAAHGLDPFGSQTQSRFT